MSTSRGSDGDFIWFEVLLVPFSRKLKANSMWIPGNAYKGFQQEKKKKKIYKMRRGAEYLLPVGGSVEPGRAGLPGTGGTGRLELYKISRWHRR